MRGYLSWVGYQLPKIIQLALYDHPLARHLLKYYSDLFRILKIRVYEPDKYI